MAQKTIDNRNSSFIRWGLLEWDTNIQLMTGDWCSWLSIKPYVTFFALSRWPLFSSDSLWSRPWWPFARWSWCSSWGPPPSSTYADGCRFCRVSKWRARRSSDGTGHFKGNFECHNNESNETEMQQMQHRVTVRWLLWLRSLLAESVGEWIREEMSFTVI